MDIFTMCAIMASELSDTSDFEETEVRGLPDGYFYEELFNRDKKDLIKVNKKLQYCEYDLGINKNKNLHIFIGKEWKKVDDLMK